MKTLLKAFYLLPVFVVMGFVTALLLNRSNPPPLRVMSGRPFITAPITNLTANLFTSENQLGPAGNDVFIEFRDAAGKLADVGDVVFELTLSGPSAVLHQTYPLRRTSTPGQYRVTVHPQVAGEWKAKITISGPSGSANATFPVTVK